MAIRKNRELGFVDAMIGGGNRTRALLERLDAATPWQTLAEPIAALNEYTNTGPGRPAWSPAVMLKCMMLAKWFNLSDPGLEEALMDRISFRKFVGLPFTDTTPDETTFVTFRKRLREAPIHDEIFDAVVRHLDSQGFLVREGTMVDATIIEQSRGRSRGDGTNTRDPDASLTKKHGVTHAAAAGVSLPPSTVEETMAFTQSLPPQTTASMQRDIIEGRPSELFDQTGAIVRIAERLAVPVPTNRTLLQILLPQERQARAITPTR